MTDRILPDEGHPCRWCEFAMCERYQTDTVRCTRNAPGPSGFPMTVYRCGQFSLDEISLNKHIAERLDYVWRRVDQAQRDLWLSQGKPALGDMLVRWWDDDMIAEWEAAKAADRQAPSQAQ